MKIRLIASDIDGTLKPYGKDISERTKLAVRRCAEANVPFVLSTGRWYVGAKKVADRLSLTDGYMIISGGGAIVRMDGTPVHEWTMRKGEPEFVYDLMNRFDVTILSFVQNALYKVNSDIPNAMSEYFGGDFRLIENDRARFEAEALHDVYKMEAVSDDPEQLARIAQCLRDEGFAVTSAYPTNIEVMSSGMGKGTALSWLSGSLGIPTEACMALGDGTNDIDLLSAAGVPVAMANGVDELKSVAKIIAPDSADDGAARVIEQALRGEL